MDCTTIKLYYTHSFSLKIMEQIVERQKRECKRAVTEGGVVVVGRVSAPQFGILPTQRAG